MPHGLLQMSKLQSNVIIGFIESVFFWTFLKRLVKVRHDGIVFKLKCNGISGNLLNFFQNDLSNRYQRVVLNGKESDWTSLQVDVPQVSVLGPLLFLISYLY